MMTVLEIAIDWLEEWKSLPSSSGDGGDLSNCDVDILAEPT